MSLLTCRHLSVSYDGKAVLSDLNFSVDEGDYLGIVGENGAGKTTLMNILYGLYHCDEGEIWWNGVKQDFQKPLDAIACGIGMVHQHFMLVEAMTVFEGVGFSAVAQ